MANSVSVSKGCFVFKPNNKSTIKQKKALKPWTSKEPWYDAHRRSWSDVEEELENLREKVFSEILESLIHYVQNCHSKKSSNIIGNEIPCATLLTGVNLPDHEALFRTLSNQCLENVTPHVAILQARHCTTVRSTVEHMVLQFISCRLSRNEEFDDNKEKKESIKKNQCNFITLSIWYKEKVQQKISKRSPRKKLKQIQDSPLLVVIIPNLEEFSSQILQNVILITSVHIKTLPFVFIFGVATAVSTLHRSVPHHVSSKLCNRVFHSPPAISYLNHIIEKVLLTSSCPFHLDGKTFKMLSDIFLFYDFSVHGFIQRFKFCMMEHFYECPWKILCCPPSDLSQTAKNLNKEDLEELRQLPSFRHYVDTLPKKEKAPLLLDDAHFRVEVVKLMKRLHGYLQNLHALLKCLHILTSSLPNTPLGKQLREVYSTATSCHIYETAPYKECFQLLAFQSRDELQNKLEEILNILKHSELNDVHKRISEYYSSIDDIALKERDNTLKSPTKLDMGENISRFQLKEKLMELSRRPKPLTLYEELRKNVLEYLSGTVFPQYLVPPTNVPLHEVLFFKNVGSVKRIIMGTPRAAIHTALNKPHYYLQCKCCKLEDSTAVVPTLPDICIVYKLHLECGKLINMYDWLQAFLAIVSPSESGEEQRDVSPEMQARFTRAVAELQYLGFIKTSKKKTDHVMRLTWGAS